MNSILRGTVAVLLLLYPANLTCDQPVLKCSVCQERIKAEYHLLEGYVRSEKQPVCGACTRLETVCSACGLPVKMNYQTLEDGRLLCEQDAKSVVFSQADMEPIWQETRRDMAVIFSGFGILPANITVLLVDRTKLTQAHKNQFSWHEQSMTLGLTSTRLRSQGEFEHTVYLLNGITPTRLAAVCAHEYAHAWLHENVSRERKLDGDTVEGFCELIAYKVMGQRNRPVEQRVILANAYTRGQIDALLKAEETFQFYRVLEWLKNGLDDRIDKDNPARLLKLQDAPAPSPVWHAVAAPTPVPDTLILKGISGSKNRRFALINDCTLQKNEEGKVRVGKTNVVVRCLEISENAVVIQARGSAQRMELRLPR